MLSMAASDDFPELIRRVRQGDADAAAAVVAQYESVIRRVIRFRLTDSRLRAVFDSMDICQSVLGSFFVRAANGDYDLQSPDELARLLVGIARNKLATQARRQSTDKRDYRRGNAEISNQDLLPGDAPSPSRHFAAKELLNAVRAKLSPEELHLAELRQAGQEWAEIAVHVGDNPAALRKRFSRAMDRVARELGLEEDSVC
jgi:RNA polymerase sigma-70 factor (ECF subfamily)